MYSGTATRSAGARVPVRIVNPNTGRGVVTVALVDTGDQRALVDPSVLAGLGATPVGSGAVAGVGSGPAIGAGKYVLDWDCGAAGYVRGVKTDAVSLAGIGVGALLGRNVPSGGFLLYDFASQRFDLSVGGAAAASVPRSGWVGPVAVGGAVALILGLFCR